MWGPLRHPVFRALWIAALASNVGTWMHDTSAAWLMTILSPSPLMVALMQTATSLPFFALALPAGALADIADRRRFLLATQVWMLVVAAIMGAVARAGLMTPGLLLGLTFLMGIGAAMTSPAWQAITPELVPREELRAAVALGGVALNVARTVGPALGGLVVAAAGPAAVFLLNAVSYVAVVGVLARWRRPEPSGELPAERVVGALRAGLRYVRHSAPLRTVLARSTAFVLFASAVWALLPLVARRELGLEATGYGALLGCLGAGAIAGAAVLPRLRAATSVDRMLAVAGLAYAVGTLVVAFVRIVPVVALGVALVGAAWMVTMSTIAVAAQEVVPGWVRARALAAGLLAIQGGMAVGAVCWGVAATRVGIPWALCASGVGLVVGLAVVTRWPLAGLDGLDLTPTRHWATPETAGETAPDDGPVLVTAEYLVDPMRAEEFVDAMQDMEDFRRRDGAIDWGLYRDTADPGRYVETFLVDSWVEHLRQHDRVTAVDRAMETRVRSFILDGEGPRITHLVAQRPPRRRGSRAT